jgi:ribose transport system substrate-binding protein
MRAKGEEMNLRSSLRRSTRAISAAVVAISMLAAGLTGISAASAATPTNVAYLSASSANTWLQASKVQMDRIAKANNIKITEFDAQFKPGEQAKQIQDVIASGKYKGLIIASVDGAGIIPSLKDAIDAGLKVGILNQVVGTKLDTAKPQFAGPSVVVMVPPKVSGERLGKLTLQACKGKTSCKVVFFYGIKGIPLDTAIKEGYDAVIATNPAISIVAEGEGKYLGPDVAQKAMQDILSSTPNFDVVVGPDQAIQGVVLALSDAGKLGTAKLIGFGGSKAAINGVKNGTWFADLFGAPATEGKLLMDAMVKALKTGKKSGGIDPGTKLPDNGLVTKANVSKFKAEWNG